VRLLKAARFVNPRVAWDGPYKDWARVKKAIKYLKDAGYNHTDIFVFMIYNCTLPYKEMRKKLDACRRWGVRVIDCRYRPLNYTDDGYKPGREPQGQGDYYIHEGWEDWQVRRFRRCVREQNIAVLLDLPNRRYIRGCELHKVAV